MTIRTTRRSMCGLWTLFIALPLLAEPQDSTQTSMPAQVLPFEHYMTLIPAPGQKDAPEVQTVDPSLLRGLTVRFHRERLNRESGPQFVRIEVISRTRAGAEVDRVVQHAFTLPKNDVPGGDLAMIEQVRQEFGISGAINADRVNVVSLLVDSLAPWGEVTVQITPDENFTRYADVGRLKRTWQYRVRGPRIESSFYIGIPKVIYDSRKADSVTYGNTSAILRFFMLDQESGEAMPVNLGVGVFGINSPIDVSDAGGGFVVSLFLDAVQLLRLRGMDITRKVNAGFEVTPFFSLRHRPRVLFNVRLGYSP